MSDHQRQYAVARMCRVLRLSRSGFYAWQNRAPSVRSLEDQVLLGRIREIHRDSRETYGTPRIHAELAAEGIHVGRKRVARLMREGGLVGITRRKRWTTTTRSERQRPAPDLVQRDFSALDRDQLWVADITYVPTWAGHVYLAVVVDAWSRKVVGWCISTSLKTKVVLDALEMAIRQRQPSNVIHHSDQGCQYTSIAFGQRCREANIRPSMGSVGDAYDNAMCESFFATLETELIERCSFRTGAEARMEVFDFIEGFYNPRRRHSALGYSSPIEFERANAKDANHVV